ncbi:protein FAM227A-like [Heterodontus francisci]|uniref:protein FAM227A-like n=1 Tax=Heterodontus francisci TaxID=7792 RepID=UPI00355B90EE
MVEINAVLTPLELYEEDMDLPVELAARQRQMVQQHLQESLARILLLPNSRAVRFLGAIWSSFMIGSINLVNEKIQHLSGTLQAHPDALLVETRARYSAQPASIQPEKLRQPIVQKFPEIHLEKRPKSKRSDVEPKLVELQQYPGFDAQEPTPLPNDTALHQIWDNVLKARRQQMKQTGYLVEFQQLLSSTLMQDILLDTFWWLFLHMYQSNYTVQYQLFDRISMHYVQLIMKCQSYYYGDRFLQELSSSLSQAVYVSFCCSFPQSWIQFHNDDFRSQVCDIVYQWFGGMHPTPRIYNNWNYAALMPPEVKDMKSRTGQDTDQDKKKETRLSLSDIHWNSRESIDSGSTKSKKSSSTSGSSEPTAQRKSFSTLPKLSRSSSWKTKRNSKIQQKSSVEGDINQLNDESSSCFDSLQSFRKMITSNHRLTGVSPHKQSLVAGRGPEFMRNLFNLFGISPLVLNYLRRLNLEPRAGKDLYVTRTEIQSLPPYPSTPSVPHNNQNK